MKTINFIVLILLVAGALTLGLNAILDTNLFEFFGKFIAKILYYAIGFAGAVGFGAIMLGKRSL
ncbi:MAG: hypothetical protein LBR35_00010 [Rickettsiales bacterium]|jgi:uncharacterized membrane protein YuzA (DUF378 family)|nr:hypothetical protein [Rickettsiales bacterium]